jgi:DMSO/TMAO reductase YedYZ molybdopterin-dependent catalytic subunit
MSRLRLMSALRRLSRRMGKTRCRKRNGRLWNLQSISMPQGILTPYFMLLDLATARHPQTLLATHLNGQPLTVDHGAPLRLLVPVKLGLKNVKAITRITYVAEEPRDYWAERGYSRYDGI